MVHSLRIRFLACAMALIAMPLAASAQKTPSANNQSATLKAPAPKASQPSEESFTAELFYEVLLSELSNSAGDPGTAYALMLEAARSSQDETLYRRATDIALQARSGESALTATKAWKHALPESRTANRYLLQILIALNRVEETAPLLSQELRQTPAPARIAAIQALPLLYGRASNKALSADIVEQALSAELKHPSLGSTAWTTVGRMRLAADDKPAALSAVTQALQLDAQNDGAVMLALELTEDGVLEAEQLTRAYFEQSPRPELRMAYSRVLVGLQRYAQAQAQLELLTKAAPDHADAWLALASLQAQADSLDDAEKSLEKFKPLAEALPEGETRRVSLTQAYLLHAQIAEKRQKFDESEAWLARIDNEKELFSAQVRRASLLARQGRLTHARALIRSLPANSPEEERLKLAAEVQLLRDGRQYQEAFTLQGELVALAPNNNDLLYDQAMLAEKAGHIETMEQLLRKIIARQPDYHHAYNALGYSLADRGVRLPEAKALIEKALHFAPADPFITDSLAWAHFRMGNRTEARRLLEAAFQKRPDAEIAAHLGEVLWSLKLQDEALAIWREGLRLNSQNETLQETLKRLGVTP
jgi:tetratricopeptide (TPR) repeat protein